MNDRISWKALGSFISMLVQLYTLVSEILKGVKANLGIVFWLLGPGKKLFSERAREIGERYVFETKVIAEQEFILETCAHLNLPGLSILERGVRPDKVEVCYLGITIGGKKVYWRHATEPNSTDKAHASGSKVQWWLGGNKNLVSADLLQFLMGEREDDIIPGSWSELQVLATPSGQGGLCHPRFYFWGTRYKDAKGREYVRYIQIQEVKDKGWVWKEGLTCVDEDFRHTDLILMVEK